MNYELKSELNKIKEEFEISNLKLEKITEAFYNDMAKKQSLMMLPTHIKAVDTVVADEYLSIDLGGSNIRISKFKIFEDNVELIHNIKVPLKNRFADYTSSKYSLKDLLVMVLKKMARFLDKEKLYSMGITISFGMESISKNKATIIELSKGFTLKDTLGEDVYQIINEAINEVNLKIIPTVILNDVVATLVTGKFNIPNARIAMIVGTGHNASFINKDGYIINIESANFNENIPVTKFDKKVGFNFPNESDKLLELMVGGKYIGAIAKEIIKELEDKKLVKEFGLITTKRLIRNLNKKYSLKYSSEQLEVLSFVTKVILKRAAKLVVAEAKAILRFMEVNLEENHSIVFDGSVYENCEYFRQEITKQLEVVFEGTKISHKLIKDASGIGAAIASSAKV